MRFFPRGVGFFGFRSGMRLLLEWEARDYAEAHTARSETLKPGGMILGSDGLSKLTERLNHRIAQIMRAFFVCLQSMRNRELNALE